MVTTTFVVIPVGGMLMMAVFIGVSIYFRYKHGYWFRRRTVHGVVPVTVGARSTHCRGRQVVHRGLVTTHGQGPPPYTVGVNQPMAYPPPGHAPGPGHHHPTQGLDPAYPPRDPQKAQPAHYGPPPGPQFYGSQPYGPHPAYGAPYPGLQHPYPGRYNGQPQAGPPMGPEYLPPPYQQQAPPQSPRPQQPGGPVPGISG